MTTPALPTWEQFMVPVLRVLADGTERSGRDVKDRVRQAAQLTDDQLAVAMDSGYNLSDNRIGWALSYLKMADAVTRPRRAHYLITDAGHQLLAEHRDGLRERDLRLIPAYVEHRQASRAVEQQSLVDPVDASLDPIEQLEEGAARIRAAIADELLERLRIHNPEFLERSVLDVLVAMGYGGANGQARRIGGSGDGGVDGVIDQDRLGLQRIYVQAKRYAADNVVGREAIQAFVGALHGRHVTNGIFITTSRFTAGAIDYADTIGTRVILIDGPRLANLMISYGVGVQTRHTYEVVELDEDYFE